MFFSFKNGSALDLGSCWFVNLLIDANGMSALNYKYNHQSYYVNFAQLEHFIQNFTEGVEINGHKNHNFVKFLDDLSHFSPPSLNLYYNT